MVGACAVVAGWRAAGEQWWPDPRGRQCHWPDQDRLQSAAGETASSHSWLHCATGRVAAKSGVSLNEAPGGGTYLRVISGSSLTHVFLRSWHHRTVSDTSAIDSSPSLWQMPRLEPDGQVVAGVSGGVATELGIDRTYVRTAFVLLGLAGGTGVLLYLALWILIRGSKAGGDYEPRDKGATPAERMIGFVMLTAGLLALAGVLMTASVGRMIWPVALMGAALAVALGHTRTRVPVSLREITRPEHSWLRLAVGLGCLFVGLVIAFFFSLSFWTAATGIGIAALVLLGAALVFAPVLGYLGSDLMTERRMRIRSEERADMAAHLHDSVLQTLTLIQKNASDNEVVGLARRQERELRSWLFEDQSIKPNLGFRAELERQMGDVEHLHGVPVEIVVVGDTHVTEDINALIAASGEAATNSAKHSGAARIDIFAEVTENDIEVFVRDQGTGFDLAGIEPDRAGVRDSILGRIERRGGTAVVHSTIGDGTEVELRLPLHGTEDDDHV